jgi:hypothetical protein
MKKSMLFNILLGFAALALTFAHSQGAEFKRIALPSQNERVSGMYCSSLKACVISTDSFGVGHIFASDGSQITGTLVTGDTNFGQQVGTLGEIGFLGFSVLKDSLVALLHGAGGGLLSAKGDIMQAASWKTSKIGSVASGGSFGLNQQMGLGVKDDRWVHFTQSMVYESSDAPSPGALWTPLWSPVSPSVPSNFDELLRADKRLCITEPGLPSSVVLLQVAFVAPDLSLILYPSGHSGSRAADRSSGKPGVCISNDGGKRFYQVTFAEVPEDQGPEGVTCISKDRCFAYSGIMNAKFIYATSNASKGADSSWAPTKLPTLRDNAVIHSIFFAPDGTNGWAVGSVSNSSVLLWSSNDGGSSWKDVSASVRAVAPDVRFHSGYAFDATHVWLGGEKDTLLNLGY